MANPAVINNLATDPDFLKLPEDQQKAVLMHVSGTAPSSAPKGPAKGSFGEFRQDYLDPLIDISRPVVSGAAATGAVGLTKIPATAIPAYTLVDAALQHLRSKPAPGIVSSVSGMEPGGLASTLTNTGEQFLGGKVIEGGLRAGYGTGKAILNANIPDPAVRDFMKLLPTGSQQLKYGGHNFLGSIAKFIEDHFSPGSKTRALDTTGSLIEDKGANIAAGMAGRSKETVKNAQQMARIIDTEVAPNSALNPLEVRPKVAPGEMGPQEVTNLLTNAPKLEATLTKSQAAGTGANLRADLKGYRLQEIMDNAKVANPDGTVRYDPAMIQAQFLDPKMQESHKILFGNSTQQSNIRQFFKNVSAAQDKMGTSGAFNRIMMWSSAITLPQVLTHAFISGSPAMAAGAAGTGLLAVGSVGLAKLLTNPKTSRIMVALAGGEPLGMSEKFAARLVSQVLQGTTVGYMNKDGSVSDAGVLRGEKIEPIGR